MVHRLVPLVATLALIPSAAAGQLSAVEKLFDNFTDFGVFITGARFIPDSRTLTAGKEGTRTQGPLLQYGAEFSWKIDEVRRPICALTADGTAPDLDECTRETDDSGRAKPLIRRLCGPDTDSPSEIHVRKLPNGTLDTAYVYTKVKCEPARDELRWLVEMGLSYIQSTAVYGRDPALKLTGVYKEAPRVAIYGTYEPLAYKPYIGLFFGLTKLDELRMQTADSLISGSAQSVSVGGALGVAANQIGALELPFAWFAEIDYSFASFPSIKWSTERNWLPGAPRRLNLSSVSLSLGLQITVKQKK